MGKNIVDYKLNYLSKTFSKIDKKGIETYVISRIWNKLDNLDIKIVCQQYVKRENGYALLDLYFPQINFGVEIDEGQHMSEEHQASDKERAEAESAKSVLKEMDTYFYDGALDLIKLYISNGVFVFFDFSVPVYIIVNGLILLTFFLIYNSIYSTKM